MQVGEVDVIGDNSVNEILQVLDKSFKSDDLTLMHKSWTSFINLKRSQSESMDSYIDQFERRIAELKREGIDLPQKVLAMQLIDAANLEAKDVQMVLTGVNYDRPDDMFEQMKRAVRKFFGEQISGSSGGKPEIKTEDVNQSSTDQKKNFNRNGRGRGGRGRGRGHSHGGRGYQRSQRKTNPLDKVAGVYTSI